MKLKMLTIKSHQQPQAFNQFSNINRMNYEEIVTAQNHLFLIISYCLDGLLNYIPNFADSNYLNKMDEYRLLLAFQLAPPSSFDLQCPLSFGGILWLIDHILKTLHRVT